MPEQRNKDHSNNAGDAGLRRTGSKAGARPREIEDIESAREMTSDVDRREAQQAGSRSMHSINTRAKVRAREKGQGVSNRGSKQEQARQKKVAPDRAA